MRTTALRVGEWTLVEANSGRLYTFLRHTAEETMLVVMNLNRNRAIWPEITA